MFYMYPHPLQLLSPKSTSLWAHELSTHRQTYVELTNTYQVAPSHDEDEDGEQPRDDLRVNNRK